MYFSHLSDSSNGTHFQNQVNAAQEAAYAHGESTGKAWHATHDGLFEAVVEESELLAKHGVYSVFSQVNLAPDQKPRSTQAYGMHKKLMC